MLTTNPTRKARTRQSISDSRLIDIGLEITREAAGMGRLRGNLSHKLKGVIEMSGHNKALLLETFLEARMTVKSERSLRNTLELKNLDYGLLEELLDLARTNPRSC